MAERKPFAALQLDALREVGNIGAGHAATALSQLLNKPIDMKVPSVAMVPFEEIADKVGGPEQVIIAIYLRVEGSVPGNMFFILDQASARRILGQLVGLEWSGSDEWSEMEWSALHEIGNILAGSYLSSLADLTGLHMSPSVPGLALDMAGAILSYGILQFGVMGEQALLIETTFLEDRAETGGFCFFIPDPDSFDKLFQALGVPV